MEHWTGEQCAFAVKSFYKHGDCAHAARREYHCHFHLGHHNPVPSAHAIQTWVSNFEQTDSAQQKKPPGKARTVPTLEIWKLLEALSWRVLHIQHVAKHDCLKFDALIYKEYCQRVYISSLIIYRWSKNWNSRTLIIQWVFVKEFQLRWKMMLNSDTIYGCLMRVIYTSTVMWTSKTFSFMPWKSTTTTRKVTGARSHPKELLDYIFSKMTMVM